MMAEVLISEVFKRQVLRDHRIKNYHNRDFVMKFPELIPSLKYVMFASPLHTT